uniref:Tachykinin precursor 1 n=1 Tax=Sphaeramia orbicularis TaxID=375764 RepID=A0A672ZQ84_9TELE
MKLLLLPVLMAFFAITQVFCEENNPREEADYWTSSNQIQDPWLANDPFREILLRMTRKPRPHQFIGLMGKRSMGKQHSFNLSTVYCIIPLYIRSQNFVLLLLSPPANAQITHKSK